jgi:hypothetical protein
VVRSLEVRHLQQDRELDAATHETSYRP